MNKWWVLWIIAVILVGIFSLFFWKYNSMVTMEEWVNTAWSQVENQYQRRMDLIPNIVSTVKWEANFEKSTLEAVIEARASATTTNITVADATEMAEFQKELLIVKMLNFTKCKEKIKKLTNFFIIL